jgi:hypothetical protein
LPSKIIGTGFDGLELMRLGACFFRFPGFRLCLLESPDTRARMKMYAGHGDFTVSTAKEEGDEVG